MTFQSPTSLSDEQLNIQELKAQLETFAEHQKQEFLNHHPITDLVLGRSDYIDQLLRRLWAASELSNQTYLSLVLSAVMVAGSFTRYQILISWWYRAKRSPLL